jgi:hypothetical protein
MNRVPFLTLMVIPNPINIIISTNTFIRFTNLKGVEDVGLIIFLDPNQLSVTVRLFLTWSQLSERIGPERLEGISLWPEPFSNKTPTYLCDSDVEVNVPINSILGLAFVLYEDEPVLRQTEGMQHVYKVSSLYKSKSETVHHCRSFRSFPTTEHSLSLTSCFPSNIFKQLLRLKSKMQQALNTRSVRSNNSVTISVDNFSTSTWEYITSSLHRHGINLSRSTTVIKSAFMERDSYVVQKFRGELFSFELTLPNHFHVAQLLFGITVGLGVRFIVPCSMRGADHNETVESSRVISHGDIINVVPFFGDRIQNDSLERVIILRYIPITGVLSVTICFIRVHDVNEMQFYLQQRGILQPDDISNNDGAAFPLHSDVEVHGKKIISVCFTNSIVTLSDGSNCTIADVINYYRNLI